MYKFLCSVIIITSLSLGLVWQQVKLIEYSYHINDSHKVVALLIDENERLGYNVASLKSPVSLNKHLAANRIELDMQQTWQNIRLAKQQPGQSKSNINNSPLKVAAKAFINIFTPKREAIAQE